MELRMSLLDSLEGHLNPIAAKVGMTPEQVKSVVSTLESKFLSGRDQNAAVTDTAKQQNVPVEKVQMIFSELGGDLLGRAESFGKGLFGR
jgi:hypothetical protein